MAERIRRLSLRSVVVRGQDDLGLPKKDVTVDDGTATRGVARLLRRAVLCGVAALVCAGLIVLVRLLLEAHHESLQREGARVEGTVVAVHDPGFSRRGEPRPTIEVRYTVRGETFTETYDSPSTQVAVKDRVISLVHDPDDPADSAVAGEPFEGPAWFVWFAVVLFLGFAMLAFGAVVGTTRWSIRLGPARTGWRPGHSHPVIGQPRVIAVIFEDGTTSILTLTRPVNLTIPIPHRDSPVLVAGAGARTTILFTSGPVLAAARERSASTR
ncbi:DUF3592 domain-containing protein [Actinokineospora cianjurensis]|uniref:Uncharacterized protein DUF3592 n=1 Tax=Actinokineospora cianjurensis TaxID=585224 RepID=A0A421B3F6_9PSEU|nr:DUF3592 domain-containing protein [Actinokineospora cianjurensis]RLK58808.1 uncharacterized protein DUF3592 [Actinokineospora cianjurensis]